MNATPVFPTEIFEKILNSFGPIRLLKARLVSKTWNQLACEELLHIKFTTTVDWTETEKFVSVFQNSFPPFFFHEVKPGCVSFTNSTELVKVLVEFAPNFGKLKLLEFSNACSMEMAIASNFTKLLQSATNLTKLTLTGTVYLPILHSAFPSLNFERLQVLKFAELESENVDDESALMFKKLIETYPSLLIKISLIYSNSDATNFVKLLEVINFIPKSFQVSLFVFMDGNYCYPVQNSHPLFSIPLTLKKLTVFGTNYFRIDENFRNILDWALRDSFEILEKFHLTIQHEDWLHTGVENIRFERLKCLLINTGKKSYHDDGWWEEDVLPVLHGSNFPCLQILQFYNTTHVPYRRMPKFTSGVFSALKTVHVSGVRLDVLKESMKCCPSLENLTTVVFIETELPELLAGFLQLKTLTLRSAITWKYKRLKYKHYDEKLESMISTLLKQMKELQEIHVTAHVSDVCWLKILFDASTGPDKIVLRNVTLKVDEDTQLPPNKDYLALLVQAHNNVQMKKW